MNTFYLALPIWCAAAQNISSTCNGNQACLASSTFDLAAESHLISDYGWLHFDHTAILAIDRRCRQVDPTYRVLTSVCLEMVAGVFAELAPTGSSA